MRYVGGKVEGMRKSWARGGEERVVIGEERSERGGGVRLGGGRSEGDKSTATRRISAYVPSFHPGMWRVGTRLTS